MVKTKVLDKKQEPRRFRLILTSEVSFVRLIFIIYPRGGIVLIPADIWKFVAGFF